MRKSKVKLAKKKRVKITSTGWGDEIEVHNDHGYCGKVLNIKKGHKCSLHYHMEKYETFYVLSGIIKMNLSFDLRSEEVIMHQGDSIDIPRQVLHKFEGLADAVVLEISTQDSGEDDIVRVEEGSTQIKQAWMCEDEEFIQWESKVNRILGK